jgi:CHAT domain-containing protein/Flp pilus assembly protein TadD
VCLTFLPACHSRLQRDPASEFSSARSEFEHGNLQAARTKAEEGIRRYTQRDSVWEWKFRLLEGNVLLSQGLSESVIGLLDVPPPTTGGGNDLRIQQQMLLGLALARVGQLSEADAHLETATQSCLESQSAACAEVQRIRGVVQVERGNLSAAEDLFREGLRLSRERHDRFFEATALLNLGVVALQRERFDEAIDWSNRAYELSQALGARQLLEKIVGNLGWAYFKVGDYEKAQELMQDAERRAHELDAPIDRVEWLTNLGLIEVKLNRPDLAEQHYETSLTIAKELREQEQIADSLTALALVSVQRGQFRQARTYADQAIAIAHSQQKRVAELYPELAKGQALAGMDDLAGAEKIVLAVVSDPKVDPSLKSESQHELANLYAQTNRVAQADGAYHSAISAFESARSSLHHEEVKLPFLSNAKSLYDDYVQFLVSQGETGKALQVADFSRAQTLTEGLGMRKGRGTFRPEEFDPRQAAREENATILFYWLGAKRSYLWAITPREIRMYPLPPAAEIDAQVQRFRRVVVGPRDLIETGYNEGTLLYQTLLAPAKEFLRLNAREIAIPDGSLNSLNFETLVVPDPTPHYWIEDATVMYASSLRLLLASAHDHRRSTPEKLLLFGDAKVPGGYANLPNASTEITDVSSHFPSSEEALYTKDNANPGAYLASHPERFSYIHFVAHGTASRISPLDSAVILSRATAQDDSFKLYARDIIQHPLRAELVTISACNGAGTRTYAGEGLVGLSWAFLRAGAHNVIGALWEVSDASTPQLMNQLYDGLGHGERPEEALRAAKLSLLHSGGVFRKPFYWAPFQLYTGA